MKFVLVGGLASNVHGYDRPTAGLNHGIAVAWDIDRFDQPSVTLVTKKGFLDLAFEPDGTKGYSDLARAAEPRQVLGVDVVVAALPDIIRSKEAANRSKDRDALPALRRLANEQI